MVTPDDNAPWVDVVGHYDDELVRAADGWRIRRRATSTPADAHRRWRHPIDDGRLRTEVRAVGRDRRRVRGGRRQPGRPIGRARTGSRADRAQRGPAGAGCGRGARAPRRRGSAAGAGPDGRRRRRPGGRRRPTDSRSDCSSTTRVPPTGRRSSSTIRSRTRCSRSSWRASGRSRWPDTSHRR